MEIWLIEIIVGVTAIGLEGFIFLGIPKIRLALEPKSGFKIERAYASSHGWFYVDVYDFELKGFTDMLSFDHEPTPNEVFEAATKKHNERKAFRDKDRAFKSRFKGVISQ